MPYPSIYHTSTRSFTPYEFVEEYNVYPSPAQAADAMGMTTRRLSVIATRLRKRGFTVRRHDRNMQ